MDPALELILREDSSARQVEVLARLWRRGLRPPGLEVVSEFGNIVTGRVSSTRLREVRRAREIVSLKAARPLVATTRDTEATINRWQPVPHGRDAGAGCLIGVLDFGLDLTNPALRKPNGNTRLAALWDQRSNGDGSSRHGYGKVLRREEINRALATGSPHAALGGPAPTTQSHGSAVLELCATQAPASDLAFVHLQANDTAGQANLGDSVRVAEALDFVRELAGNRPWVANLSIGSNGGPRDGTTLLEQAIDAIHEQNPAACIVCSAGNYGNAAMHAFGTVARDNQTIEFDLDPSAHTPELEIWYSRHDALRITLEHVATRLRATAALGEEALLGMGDIAAILYHRRHDPNNRDHHVDVFLTPHAPPGRWRITLEPIKVVDGRYHAWIERCPSRSARFVASDSFEATTLGTLGACRSAVVVGALDDNERGVASYASVGPTRDGRAKPDLLARGSNVTLPFTNGSHPVSGASFAAPQVASLMATLLARGATREQARKLLTATGAPVEQTSAMRIRPTTVLTTPLPQTREMHAPYSQPLGATWSDLINNGQSDEFEVIAGPGQPVPLPIQPNAWVVERGPGPNNLATVYPVAEAMQDRRVALLDSNGNLRQGRMLVKPRLPI